MNPCARLPREVARAVAAGVVVALLVVQFGCATRPPTLDLHWQLRNEVTALVPAQLETRLSLEPFAAGRPTGALQGAEAGFVGCLQGFGGAHCSGDICGAVLLIMLGVALTCSAIGAVAGAIQATPADDANAMTVSMAQMTKQLVSHLDLTRRVLVKTDRFEGLTVDLVDEPELVWLEEPPRWQALKGRGFVNALEIGVTDIEFIGGSGSDPELALHMVARARLIDLASGAETYRQEFSFFEAPKPFTRWVSGQGDAMQHAVERGLEKLAADIASRLFEQVDLQIPSGTWTLPGSERFSCCWLCPQSPPLDYAFWGARLNYPPVASAQPTLKWEAFPTPDQAAALRANHGLEATGVSYDLRIWEVRQEQVGPLVYERTGLPEPRHRVEVPLKPHWRYFWSMRACFDAGAGRLCTPWAWSLAPGGMACEVPAIPAANYYRFTVP